MAECATVPSNFKPHWITSNAVGSGLKPRKLFSKNIPRSCKFSSVSMLNVYKDNAVSVSTYNIKSPVLGKSLLRCSCLGTIIDFENADASDWVPIIDQVLLTTTVFLTYMAGVIPSGRYTSSQNKNLNDLPESPICTKEKEDEMSYQCPWDVVKRKITNSLTAIENGDITETNFLELEQDPVKRRLSLSAVGTAPRFRLLLSALEQLQMEVSEIPKKTDVFERDEWLRLFSIIVKKTCQSAFLLWMDKEFCTADCRPNKDLLSSMSEKLKGDESILGNMKKSGKIDLYADLMGFLRYSLFRSFSYYDHSIYPLHGVVVLEDLVITLADAIASMYLELVSVDSDISEKVSISGLSFCTLSTRALQKLRNEVAMSQWIHQNFGEIVLMYEDRFDLRVLKMESYREPVQKQKEDLSWWRRFTLRKSATLQSSQCYAVVSDFSLPLKRTRELRSLKGWKYYFSLFLELSDVALPIIKVIVAQVRNALSFFLVSLIGRSVGLVYSGIRQSLRWK